MISTQYSLVCVLSALRRLHNKGVYFKIGLRKMMFRRSCKDLHQAIRLEVDGKVVDLPPVEGIIILNILRSVDQSQSTTLTVATNRGNAFVCHHQTCPSSHQLVSALSATEPFWFQLLVSGTDCWHTSHRRRRYTYSNAI